jgi:hypothetical protein
MLVLVLLLLLLEQQVKSGGNAPPMCFLVPKCAPVDFVRLDQYN